MDEFMERPTDVLVSYLARRNKRAEGQIRRQLRYGRLAMALEIITVMKIIEDHSLLPSKEDTIAVLQTLIVDQELLEDAGQCYEVLNEWRKIKFYDDASYVAPDVQPSEHVAPRGTTLPRGSNDAPHGSDRSRDPS